MVIAGDKNSECKLCLSKAKPLCKSHVVPEFCYGYEYNGNRRHAISINLPNEDQIQKGIIQKGYREYLLCPDCEQRLSCHERIFSEYWNSKVEIKGPLKHGQFIILDGVNYHSTKLFILSVFWRCSISQKFGKGIKLGPYAEKLRLILLNNKPVPQDHYPLFCSIILDPSGFPFNGYVDNPYCIRVEGTRSYRMAFKGCMWTLVMSDNWVPSKLKSLKYVLSESGNLHLLAQNYTSFKSIQQIFRAIRKSENGNV